DLIERRAAQLEEWQDAAWAERYRADIGRVREAERRLGREDLTKAAAIALHKLMSYKDEYEVARLYTDGAFQKALAERFEDGGRLEFHLAPPLLARRDETSGHLRKSSFGPWMMGAFRLLARLKGLRGTVFDPFGWTEERRMERRLIDEYRAALDEVLAGLTAANHALAVEIAALPSTMRGFGHVKAANVAKAKARERDLMARYRSPAEARCEAAE
ncbi:MAG: indolepyruvate ferredoxin oxidoreductase family protein, partial [Alphaproteobacteria bacterium]|nr:indolepyruvate ferredoxin oxidoreductase family protein [Alphaproteobacteria bacterium]